MIVDTTLLHPELQDKWRQLLHRCSGYPDLTKDGLSIICTEARRPDLIQARYFIQGRTPSEIAAELDHHEATPDQRALISQALREVWPDLTKILPEERVPGRIVTYALPFTGPHCLGVALHFGIKKGARLLYPDAPWATVGQLATRIGLVWGGNWPMRDMAHLELMKPWRPVSPKAKAA